MTMSLSLRKLALTAHVTSSVGWLGAVAGFLALAIAGMTTADPQLVRASYMALNVIGWFVIVPLCLTSLPSGLVMSLGTEWGLFRHWWVVAKLGITLLATVLLLVHMQPVGHIAAAVAERTLKDGELAGLRLQLVTDAGAAVAALLIATVLSIYKPRGLTAHGRRVAAHRAGAEPGDSMPAAAIPRWVKVAILTLALLAVTFVIRHLGSGVGH